MADEMELRCSDAEREATIARLRDAAGEGRLQHPHREHHGRNEVKRDLPRRRRSRVGHGGRHELPPS